jgi:hypothetical protein
MPVTRPLFDLAAPTAAGLFTPVDDVVMGGRSRSRAALVGPVLVFSGAVSLDQGGGFASIRSGAGPLDLSGCTALSLRVRGDGHRYKVNLRIDAAVDGIAWQARLEVPAVEWRTVVLPLTAFLPTWRGRLVPEAGALEPGRLASLGFLIADGQAGPFRLEIASIEAVTSAQPLAAPRVDRPRTP